MSKMKLHEADLIHRKAAIIEINREYSQRFMSERHVKLNVLKEMGVKIIAFKCSDGRAHASSYFGLPEGLILPFRNIGGRFDLENWWHLNTSFLAETKRWLEYVNEFLVLTTYHYSEGHPDLCCAGFDNDTQKAMEASIALRDQFLKLFPKKQTCLFHIHPILCGFETDLERVIFHNEHGDKFDPIGYLNADDQEITSVIDRMFKKESIKIKDAIERLIMRNIPHIKQVMARNKPLVDLGHRECILGVGKGFWYMNRPNKAIIVGPYDPKLEERIAVAAHVVDENLKKGLIKHGVVLITSTLADSDNACDIYPARARVLSMQKTALNVIGESYPHLLDKVLSMPVVVNRETMKFTEVQIK